MRDFLEKINATQREAQDTGQPDNPVKPAKSITTVEATKQLGIMLKGTSGNLTPSHYWTQVKAIGMNKVRAEDICDGLGQSDDWREVLSIAYNEMAALYEL